MAQPSTAMLLERWRDRAEYDRLAELAMAEPMVADAGGAAKELQMAVEKLLEDVWAGPQDGRIVAKSGGNGLELRRKGGIKLTSQDQGRPRAPS